MGCRSLVAAVALAMASPVLAQGPPTWSVTLGGDASSEGVLDVREAADGTLLVAGYTDSFGTGTGDAWRLRLDGDGHVLEESVHGEAVPGGTAGAALADDGSVVFVGRNVVELFLVHHAWAVSLDASGSVLWQRKFQTPIGRHSLEHVEATTDGGWIAAGTTAPSDAGPHEAWVVKLDANGFIQWQSKYGGGSAELPREILQTSDGGYLLVGQTSSSGRGLEDAWVAKIDAAGTLEWQQTYGGRDGDEASDVVELPGGGYVVAGYTNSFTAGGHAGWVFALDAAGVPTWSRVFGDTEWCEFRHVTLTADGDVVVTGRLGQLGFPSNDLWLAKLSSADGAVLWQRAHEGVRGDWGGPTVELADGGLFVGGQWAWGFAEEALWLLRTDEEGRVADCDIERDPAVPSADVPLGALDGVAAAGLPDNAPAPIDVQRAPSAAVRTPICAAAGCPPLSCAEITAEPSPGCAAEPSTFTAFVTGGEGALTHEWDVTGDGVPDFSGNPVQGSYPPGTWTVTVFVTDECADPGPQTCEMSAEIVVHPLPAPDIRPLGPRVFCADAGESVVLETDPGFVSYQWFRDGVAIPGETDPSLTATQTGAYSVRVVDANGCAGTSDELTVDADACGCDELVCLSVSVDPDPACEGEEQTFLAEASGGEGALTYTWDFDGDGAADATGNPVTTTLPVGTWTVTVTVNDECDRPMPESCTADVSATVRPSDPPAEISDVRAGEPPLLVRPGGTELVVERDPAVAVLNVYVDAIGSWYAPADPTGRTCHVGTWTNNGDGTITLQHELPNDSWVLVSGAGLCTEGPVGRDSRLAARESVGVWELCGAP